ncbi:thiamine biosynthesis protein ThiJ [Hydrogenophaga crassostreae]|uniref:Thiamine biosynthesis protein ThiJ n=1 Tax=Hydrogenophaga crassostreae TaxID=1763535 RepID=A0A162Z6T4_9BURK|nr:DJ-1/PfpI family protein [Hydrogenophaga crassostreae]AOW14045.1 thiamine biosynthesis protein ThiJ [Hydrogenophaga crassostreae]OAD43992.1 thiamine biosynthesis protein ThiJ [Hydrogenophaga crassostreae]
MSPVFHTLQVAILAFNGVEALDLAGPYEVFTTASRMQQRIAPGSANPFDVSCVARDHQAVQARAGMALLPTHSFSDCPPVDVLVVPGGVVEGAMQCANTLAWVASLHTRTVLTASVCTGAFLLAESGALRNGPVTTHWEDQADLAARYPRLEVRSGARWVEQEQERLITSGGISAGIDMALHIVARLANEALALRTAKQMEFQWTRN